MIFTLGRHLRRRVLPSAIASVRPSVCPFVRPEWRYRSNSLGISATFLNFCEVMHSTME